MTVNAGHRNATARRSGRRAASLVAVLSVVVAGLTVTPPAATAAPGTAAAESSDVRVGVLALAGAIAAVGRTPELAGTLPFTRTSVADVLRLDDVVTSDLTDALAGSDLATALAEVRGIRDVEVTDGGDTITFGYAQKATVPLQLAYDDGDLRFGANAGAGDLTVSLATPAGGTPFVVHVDRSQTDPLLKFALVSQPQLTLDVAVTQADVAPFTARQGFTDVRVTGGHYQVRRTDDITLRDPDGRGLLTLEDLRYSTLPDLFRITPTQDQVDIGFGLRLPDSVAVGGAVSGAGEDARLGTFTLTGPASGDTAWPDPATDGTRSYGDALGAVTGLSLVDGITSLSKYTGAALALQDAADVPFPNLGGGTGDLFAPGDQLLDMLSTSAVAQIRCGLSPGSPPTGTPAPGDTVYCDAVAAEGLGTITGATWSTVGGGTVATTGAADQRKAVGVHPQGTVQIDGSDGEPDVVVTLTLKGGRTMVARSMPRTVQDVVSRIRQLGDHGAATAGATVDLAGHRLDVDVDLRDGAVSKPLSVGNPGTLGALVGLTGLEAGGAAAQATARATDASFDVGFGIATSAPTAGQERSTVLLPRDETLIQVTGVSATPPSNVQGLPARVGFLGVDVDLGDVALDTLDGPAASLRRLGGATGPLSLGSLLTDKGTLTPGVLGLQSHVTADVSFDARERSLGADRYASGAGGPASGSATVHWGTTGVPSVSTTTGYRKLRLFDPVPAAFLSGTAAVTAGSPDTVSIATGGDSLYATLGVPATPGVEVARRMIGPGIACQNVTVTDAHHLTCEGLAPDGTAAVTNGASVDLIVLGDPFALRDGVIEGLAGTLNAFDTLGSDHRPADGLVDDQYTATLPLVDLTPAQLAGERGALGTGLADLADAATEDESGTHGGLLPVSSAQEMATAVSSLVPGSTGLTYTLGTDRLGVSLGAAAAATLKAPLRFMVNGRGQVQSDDTVDVGTTSTTTLAIDVDTATARARTSAGTGTTSTATLGLASFAGKRLRAGVGAGTTQGSGSSAALAVTVDTTYDGTAEQLETSRSTTGVPAGSTTAATARLALVGETQPIVYSALATDSSGGAGAAQPAPEAMQVKFLAEGLDGLADAVGNALDGAAPRNTGPSGVPVSAPLIGSDLDAGANVRGVLTGLTSALRTQLAGVTATSATDLADALATRTDAAVRTAPGVSGDGATAEVTCAQGKACEPCPDDADGNPTSCAADGPKAWDTVRIHTTLTGDARTGKTQFEVGLDGLSVTSDKEVDTSTSWTLPITLELKRGVGPRVVVDSGDTLALDASAALPTGGACAAGTHCIKAIVGYLPAKLTATGADGTVDVGVRVKPAAGAYDLFDLYDGSLKAVPGFSDEGALHDEDGLRLGFETLSSSAGAFDLLGSIHVPWTPAAGFDAVTYDQVKLDVGELIATLAKPFDVVDPYLGPARDVIDVLRTPMPVVSDLSELGGGDEISLLSLLDTLSGADKRLELAYRVISFIDSATQIVGAIAPYAKQQVPLEDLAASGALLTLQPSEVELSSSCTQTVRTSTTVTPPGGASTTATTRAKSPCPEPDAEEQAKPGVRDQTTAEKRKGTRRVKESVSQTTKSLTGSAPGFSLPFLADPDQLVDVLTGEGEVSYFRLDFGSLVAKVAYTQSFGPIMAGPVPIKPFVGGSISVEGRMAAGFDSMPQTLAARSLSHAGDVDGLIAAYGGFDGGIITEGFYLDDLDGEGVDVPEVKLVATLEAGAGVSIGIVTAGLKGGVTLTINLDLNDPNDDGKLRTAEIRDLFAGNATCVFDASATIEAFIAVFVEIELVFTSLSWEFDLLRLGPYTLFEYGCPDTLPSLVKLVSGRLTLTSGSESSLRASAQASDNADANADDYEVRQFDTGDGAQGSGTTTYEVSALNRVQRVVVAKESSGGGYDVTVYKTATAVSTEVQDHADDAAYPDFLADGGAQDDKLSFLRGETFTDDGTFVGTDFTTPVTVTGGAGADLLVTGDGADSLSGGAGTDTLTAGLGDDRLDGGDDQDILDGGAGSDDLLGGSGSDRVAGGPGADRAVGGDGDDSLVGGPGRDVRAVLVDLGPAEVEKQVRLGFDSGDVLVGGEGADSVDGGDGSDVVVGGNAPGLTTGAASALFQTGSRSAYVLTRGHTNPVATPVSVTTATVPGASQLDGLCTSGTQVDGATGRDLVTGGDEADVVVGGDGSDDLDGGSGPDEICGRNGADQISGDGAAPVNPDESYDDVVRGGLGSDRVDAGAGRDVVFGDDVTLVRSGERVLDGSLGSDAAGSGNDYLEGGDADDVLSGGGGSDLVIGGAGDDVASGEGNGTVATGGPAPSLADRLVDCATATRVVHGYVDLNGDLLAGPTGPTGTAPDDGNLAGLVVVGGVIRTLGSTTALTGLVGGGTVVIDGRVDLDRDGTVTDADTGTVPLASMRGTTPANASGDCVLGGEGDDRLSGGAGSDYLGGGDGTDLADGGDGNDLVLGDAGTDVLLGGPHQDVLVGGVGDDHLLGGGGDDRLRGNEGDDTLVGGGETSGTTDGEDVELGGRGADVLVAENGSVVSQSVVTQVAAAGWRTAPGVPAAVLTGAGSARFEGSAVLCGAQTEATRWVTLLAGGAQTRTPTASPGGPVLYDELYGGYDCDWVFGSRGDDLVRGGQGDDVVEGSSGNDTAYGDAGDDVVVAGSTVDPTTDARVTVTRGAAGVADGRDTVYGDGGPDGEVGRDLVTGDNATPVRTTGSTYAVRLQDVQKAGALVPAAAYGDDVVYGDAAGVATTGGQDRIFGQGGDDTLNGGGGDDYVEGNSGTDTINGGDGQDDLVGGSSAADGLPLGATATRLAQVVPAVDPSAAGLLDERDVVHGGAGHDVLLGDNGRITRPAGGTIDSSHAYRGVAMADTAAGATSGSDDLWGDQGDDVVYGQMDDTARPATGTVLGTGDTMHGGPDADSLLGDLGVVQPTPATGARRLVSNGSFVQEDVFQAGTLVPVTTVPAALVGIGGSDVAFGDGGNDTIRLGADRDLANGGADDDVVIGGDADDALWGGTGHDRLFGGYGDDHLDLKRPGTGAPSYWSTYATVAGVEDLDDKASTTNGADLAYGGWGADTMQADQGGAGRQPGSDQLVDWVGNHNLYLVCNGAYGAGYVLRQSSPDMESLLSTLVVAAGGTDVATAESAAFYDLGLVTNSGNSANAKPIAGAPGNYTCEGAG